MVTIFTSPRNNNRLIYTASHLFNNILGVEFRITPNKDFFLKQTGPCINYSKVKLNHGFQIIPHGLLGETGVHPVREWNVGEWKGLFCFCFNGKGDIPFDLFAATFALLTLYQEYFPKKLDEHQRFDHREALLFRNNSLETPVIDRWAYLLKAEWEAAGLQTADFQLRKYRVLPTYDIDFPYLYMNKGVVKTAGCFLRDAVKRNSKELKNRFSTLAGRQEDPYMNALRFIEEVHQRLQEPYYLFILQDNGNKRYYEYLKNLDLAHLGLHGSYSTLHAPKTLRKEKQSLEKRIQHPVSLSRQHFLRMQAPRTFLDLTKMGIREDFTLTFSKAPGFRAGTAIPFYFYDLKADEITGLLVHPTIVMDATFIFHLKLEPEAALQKIKTLIDACRQSGGDYVSLWHNSNLAYSPEENPWIDVYIQSMKYAISPEKSLTLDTKTQLLYDRS